MSFGPRMTPGFVVIAALAIFLLYSCSVRAHGAFKPAPLPYTCEEVRVAIAHFTVPHLETIAKDLGIKITQYQRRQVAACMKGVK